MTRQKAVVGGWLENKSIQVALKHSICGGKSENPLPLLFKESRSMWPPYGIAKACFKHEAQATFDQSSIFREESKNSTNPNDSLSALVLTSYVGSRPIILCLEELE